MKTKFSLSVFTVMLLTFVSILGTVSAATLTANIDFEGIPAGTIVTSLASGNGVSGDAFGGVILVEGARTNAPGNAAMIFDSSCGGSAAGCTGGDTDLFNTELSKTMIVSEDLDELDPDDNQNGGWLHFNLAGFGPGVFTVNSANVIDLEGGGSIVFYDAAMNIIATVTLPFLGDGEQALKPLNVEGVTSFRVRLTESGAIDNIRLSFEEPEEPGGDEGCTPGYWKQPQHFDSWVGYLPGDSYDALFGTSTGLTLLEALNANGNRNGEAYLRHSVAALLNAASSVDYAYSVEAILAGDYTKDELEAANEAGCPLN